MAKPYFYRWSDEVAEAVEARRVKMGVKSTKEALDALVLAGLERPKGRAPVHVLGDPTASVGGSALPIQPVNAPSGSIKAAQRDQMREGYEEKPAGPVYAGDVVRKATPKPQKGKK